jgi:hypothetical protein
MLSDVGKTDVIKSVHFCGRQRCLEIWTIETVRTDSKSQETFRCKSIAYTYT